MDSKDRVRRLIVGKVEIDRMTSEIELVVQMVIDLVDHDLLKIKNFKERIFDTFRCQWRFFSYDVNASSPFSEQLELGVECYLLKGDYLELAYRSTSGRNSISTLDIQGIHDSLPSLIEGAAQVFPSLLKKWQPFIDASLAVESRALPH